MTPDNPSAAPDPGRPIVFRGGTVLTMDGAGIIDGGDVVVIDASNGILMPGMIDTHRHLWQTALRGLGADWTRPQYFVFYYLTWGKIFRPEDIHAGNRLAAIEAIDAGVTTTVDWSHGLQTVEHGDAAVEALGAVPGRLVARAADQLWRRGIPGGPRRRPRTVCPGLRQPARRALGVGGQRRIQD